MTLSHPGRLGLADYLRNSCKTILRTLATMNKSVDKAQMDPERYSLNKFELQDRCSQLPSLEPIVPVLAGTTPAY
jgi:hypothetical protein